MKKMLLLCFSTVLLFSGVLFSGKAQASYRTQNTFFSFRTVATSDATWGTDLFKGNDAHKKHIRILPKWSQWKVFGYTRRADGYYYWLGGNQWAKASQMRIPVYNRWNAYLDVVAKFGDVDNSDFTILGNSVDPAPWQDYGDGDRYMEVNEDPIDWSGNQIRSHIYYVYPSGYATIEY